MPRNRRVGLLYFKVDGTQYNAKGNFTYNLGNDKREAVVGADRVHGYKVMRQVPFIEGEITDSGDLSLATLQNLDESTVTLELENGKSIVLRDAWYAHEGTGGTEEGGIPVRFEGYSAEEVAAA